MGGTLPTGERGVIVLTDDLFVRPAGYSIGQSCTGMFSCMWSR